MRIDTSFEKINTTVTGYFATLNAATQAPVTGLEQGDFSIALYNPSGNEVSGSVSVTIAELGSSGNYKATFTPNATGEWLLVITHATYFSGGKKETYLVYDALLGASEDDSIAHYFEVISTAGAAQTGLVTGDFTFELYNPSDTEVSGSVTVTVTELGGGRYKASYTADAEGKWLLVVKHATHFPGGKRAVGRYYVVTVTAPSAPTISAAVDDETGTSATLTLALNNESNLVYVYYRKTSDSAWSLFNTPRTGSGDLQVTGLGQYRYEFIALEKSHLTSEWSLPSNPMFVRVTTGSTITASGGVSLPLEHVRTLLANSATFQSQVGANDANEAKDYIHLQAVEADSAGTDRAVVSHLDAEGNAIASGFSYAEGGAVRVVIEFEIPETYQDYGDDELEEAELWFLNLIGAIKYEMEALAGSAGYLDAEVIGVREIDRSSYADEGQDRWSFRAPVDLEWGRR